MDITEGFDEPKPVVCSRNTRHSHTKPGWCNLGGVKEVCTEETDGEEEVEEENKEDADNLRCVV